MSKTSFCTHVKSVLSTSWEDIHRKKANQEVCVTCLTQGAPLWLCLSCLYVGCGEQKGDHTLHHFEENQHSLAINLSTMRIWCYICDAEVFREGNVPPLKWAVKSLHKHPKQRHFTASLTPDLSENDSETDEEETVKRPRGLTGLQNLGNTCYMNAALQALSNCPPLIRFFLDCPGFVRSDLRPMLSRSYMGLVRDLWHKRRPSYIVPSSVMAGIKNVQPAFRGYTQQDAQEFLHCFLDQLHKELRFPVREMEELSTMEELQPGPMAEEEVTGNVESESVVPAHSGRIPRGSGDHCLEQMDSTGSEAGSSPTSEGGCAGDSPEPVGSVSSRGRPGTMKGDKRKKPLEYRSIVSDLFDGRILSSVQCLSCERVSSTKETFQDLSLPIPGRDRLSSMSVTEANMHVSPGWMKWLWGYLKSWFWGPTVTLSECLAAFFSADELKEDNMYSCEKCDKLRNGVKYSQVLKLPEVLCIHLKRFRHEFMFSSKINSYVSFPLETLDMKPYLHKECSDQVTSYELMSVICHHGTSGAGHYTTYAQNYLNSYWYEFDDQFVTEVDFMQVENSQAYVLFYRKKNDDMIPLRMKAQKLQSSMMQEPSLMKFYMSKQWINKFNMFAEPGSVTNSDFLCPHGGMPPDLWTEAGLLVEEVPEELWEMFYRRYGGGPIVNRLHECSVCAAEQSRLRARQKKEIETYLKLHQEFQHDGNDVVYAISMNWFRQWELFVKTKTDDPPGPIDNTNISLGRPPVVRPNSDYGQLSREMWLYLLRVYGGGPELILHQSPLANEESDEEQSVISNESGKNEPQNAIDQEMNEAPSS